MTKKKRKERSSRAIESDMLREGTGRERGDGENKGDGKAGDRASKTNKQT